MAPALWKREVVFFLGISPHPPSARNDTPHGEPKENPNKKSERWWRKRVVKNPVLFSMKTTAPKGSN